MAVVVPDMDIGKNWIRGLPKGLPKIRQNMAQVMKRAKSRGAERGEGDGARVEQKLGRRACARRPSSRA
ncbi:hypothetical protein [Catenulispora acidiphila]|uniref:hypothetical protein n=1 Tax=Catenulispora acidiphila TaxID=304895 RepID=UPI0011808DE4|nr:hypothetical protein [Catenulispora acidiphila]